MQYARHKSRLVALGRKGIAFAGDDSGQRTEYLFTKLNDIKPAMIEQATENARSVAEKFAADSKSSLGKIKSANQGLFSIEDRDSNTPYLKKYAWSRRSIIIWQIKLSWSSTVIDSLEAACYFARIIPDAVPLKCPSTMTLSIVHRKNHCISFMKMMIWW